MVSRLAAGLALLALVVAAATIPANAAAGRTPCWKKVLNDWYDNSRLDRKYPAHCYREALKRLPEDVRDYTTLGDQLEAALLATARHPTHGSGSGGNGGQSAG